MDSDGNVLFDIPNGGFIKLTYGNGDSKYALCHYIDEEQVKIDGYSLKIQQFTLKMKYNGIDFTPIK